jgi:hypothetical protein
MLNKINKKGWIRIVEAFISVLLIIGAAIILIRGGVQGEDVSEKIYDIEISVLRKIELNDSLRSEILGTGGIIWWADFPSQTKTEIISETPEWLECIAKICPPENTCLLEEESEKNIYAQSILITSNLSSFNPRQLKLFCWEK